MAYRDQPRPFEDPRVYYTLISYSGGPFEQITQVSEGLTDLYFEHYPAVVVDDFLQPLVAWTVFWDDSYVNTSVYSRSLSMIYKEDFELINLEMNITTRLVTTRSGDAHIVLLRYLPDETSQVMHSVKPRTHPGSRVVLDPQMYYPGDPFDLSVELTNPTQQVLDVDVYICLEAYGVYYFYPGWSEEPDSTHHELTPGAVETIDLLHFAMPGELPDAGPFHVFSGMLDTQTGELAGDYSGAGFVLWASR